MRESVLPCPKLFLTFAMTMMSMIIAISIVVGRIMVMNKRNSGDHSNNSGDANSSNFNNSSRIAMHHGYFGCCVARIGPPDHLLR